MLIECEFCGAPLDVSAGATISRCAYCGRTHRVSANRTLAAETPPAWSPPPRWRPPAHVPADSNIELSYAPSASSGSSGRVFLGVFITLAVVGGIIAAIVAIVKSSSASSLDGVRTVTLDESADELVQKAGGHREEDAHWVQVMLPDPFNLVIFEYDDTWKNVMDVAVNFESNQGCTNEVEDIRAAFKRDLPRFNGVAYRWGPVFLNFDEKCSNFGIHVDKDARATELARFKALWAVVLADAFGAKVTLDDDARALLGAGYPMATIADAVLGVDIDHIHDRVAKSIPGGYVSDEGELTVSVPIPLPHFSSVDFYFENKQGATAQQILVRTVDNAEIADVAALGRCIGKRLGAAVEVVETDHMKHKSSANMTAGKTMIGVSGTDVNVHPMGDALVGAEAKDALLAVEACDR